MLLFPHNICRFIPKITESLLCISMLPPSQNYFHSMDRNILQNFSKCRVQKVCTHWSFFNLSKVILGWTDICRMHGHPLKFYSGLPQSGFYQVAMFSKWVKTLQSFSKNDSIQCGCSGWFAQKSAKPLYVGRTTIPPSYLGPIQW